jgi:hypothetical protein
VLPAPDLLSLVAPNGLGHFRRQVGILSRLLERQPSLRIHVLCADFQLALTRDWDTAVQLFSNPRVVRTGGILDPGVIWSTNAARYDDGRLLGWIEKLGRLPDLTRARLVVSDNLAGVLKYRTDAILSGSFLWGDVLASAHPDSRPVRDFARCEEELLARHRPPMLCVRDIAMPAVLDHTQPVGLDWMAESDPVPPQPRHGLPRIGLLGGASGAADGLLARATHALAHTGKYELALPASLAHEARRPVVFAHGRDDYASLSVAVCRPGIGTVSACITAGVPMVTLHEGPSNPELSHIGARLEQLGIAVNLGADPDERAFVSGVEHVLDETVSAAIQARMSALPRQGFCQAVDFLVGRL